MLVVHFQIFLSPQLAQKGMGNKTWFQTQLILTTCQIRYHSQCRIIVALDSSEP